jgi:hypothetical protein
MAYKVIRHPLVKSDLFKITIFIGDYAGYDIAKKNLMRLKAAFSR